MSFVSMHRFSEVHSFIHLVALTIERRSRGKNNKACKDMNLFGPEYKLLGQDLYNFG